MGWALEPKLKLKLKLELAVELQLGNTFAGRGKVAIMCHLYETMERVILCKLKAQTFINLIS